MVGRKRSSVFFNGMIAGAAAVVGYAAAIRPRILTWGATEDEVKRSLPGDELVPRPKMASTHAITINAAAAEVWPWLVQIGYQRAGWYSHDWLHRLMGVAGSVDDDQCSADRIIPELQDLAVGDVVEIGPDMGYTVVEIEPRRALVLHTAVDMSDMSDWRSFDPDEEMPESYLNSSWAWVLDEVDADTTRLIVRIRQDFNQSPLSTLMNWGIELGSFVMESETLRGIKQRVEARAASDSGGKVESSGSDEKEAGL